MTCRARDPACEADCRSNAITRTIVALARPKPIAAGPYPTECSFSIIANQTHDRPGSQGCAVWSTTSLQREYATCDKLSTSSIAKASVYAFFKLMYRS